MSEGLPVGWTARPVGEAGEVLLGRQRSPDQMTGQHPTPYLRVANVLDGRIDFSDVLIMNFTPTERAVYGLRPGDILLNEGQSLDLVGRSSIYDGPPDTYCIQNTLVRFRPKPGLRSRYAQAVFSRWVRQRTLTQIAKQTTSIAHLGASRFAALMFPEPPEHEQQRIAEILDALDRAIRASEQVITKLEMLKRGLLHDLLSPDRALGTPHSLESELNLRNIAHPSRTPVSRVAVPLGHHLVAIEAGVSPDLQDRPANSSEWGVLKVSAVRPDGFREQENKAVTKSRLIDTAIEVHSGDLLMTRSNTTELVGLVCLVGPVRAGLMLCDKTLRLKTRPSLLPEFAFWTLQTDTLRKQIEDKATGSSRSMKNITQDAISKLLIPVPGVEEQRTISQHMQRADMRLRNEVALRDKLILLKHGLTDDLLTGRVRVFPHPR